MLPEGTEVMRRLACADVCPAQDSPRARALSPPSTLPQHRSKPPENKELLRQQLLSAVSKEQQPQAEPKAPKAKLTRNRQKNRWKLKFHHQALPPEYLDHYEQSLQKGNQPKTSQEKPHISRSQQEKLVKIEPSIDTSNLTNGSFKLWAERLHSLQRERSTQVTPTSLLNSPILGSMIKMPTPKHAPKLEADKRKRHQQQPAIAPSKIVKYNDLPYMGEMTLNNSKPRRGRKPKKADICHLIYENYGTIVPGQPITPQDEKLGLSMCDSFRNRMKSEPEPSVVTRTNMPKTDLQNKIISSLLERKLSQEKKRETLRTGNSLEEPQTLTSDDGPLNLCIRDLTDLRIQIQKKFSDVYTSLPDVKRETDLDYPEDSALTSNTISVIQRTPSSESSPDLTRFPGKCSPSLSEPTQASPASLSVDGKMQQGYVYWPQAGIYLHPLALQSQLMYYHKLASRQLAKGQGDETMPSTPNSTVSDSTELSTPPVDESKSKLVLKQMSELLDPKIIKPAKKSPDPSNLKRASPNPSVQGPTKRKRSAIFIPPMPAKTNSSTPTTEVSICKFKFTGGSKPSLQEKKMLSVDSGGNFRYYSGTGNKASRGYEYFPRDPATQELCESSSGQASPSFDAKTFAEYRPSSRNINQGPSGATSSSQSSTVGLESKKKRKSRKSLQREKLEQTFKEKGFLIQTQQRQSAEGATYCKFRQLRKFTRYLFRSWKDYLPGNLEGERNQQSEPLTTPGPVPCEEEWS